ncbi:MAG: M20/M25/M40 family metallo-hydrolase [Oscillospiraceae bacterium]|nr:M20/M25/M40 family metallo-hydrolase [Oscillospiraceae bacterium]
MGLCERLGGTDMITEGILSVFAEFCRIPHGSGNEKAVGVLLLEKLKALGGSPVQDAAGNVMAEIPATPGYEHAPRLIVQGHMDMVCAVAPGSGYVPQRDPIHMVTDGAFLRSDGRSSLGADNNLGNAAALWLVGKGVQHGPIRFLFTVSEEIGLQGAQTVSPTWLDGADFLLNTDGFHLEQCIVGSAGGCRATYTRKVETVPAPDIGALCLTLSGGIGGHSGDNIHLGRGNSIKLLAALLEELFATVPGLELSGLSGGEAHNAIPGFAQAVLLLPPAARPAFHACIDKFRATLADLYGKTDPKLSLSWSDAPRQSTVWAPGFCRETCRLLDGLHSGIHAMHSVLPDVVSASANLGCVKEEDGMLSVCLFSRYMTQAERLALTGEQERLAAQAGFSPAACAEYPAWPGDVENPLARAIATRFRSETGRDVIFSICHVGLEPSVFYAKKPGLTMTCIGPDILDAHSVDERVPLEGIADFAVLLAGGIEAVAEGAVR